MSNISLNFKSVATKELIQVVWKSLKLKAAEIASIYKQTNASIYRNLAPYLTLRKDQDIFNILLPNICTSKIIWISHAN